MSKKFKMVVPKAGSCNKHGTDVKLYQLDEIVEVKEDWQQSLMDGFIKNGFAIEIKMDSVEKTVEVEAKVKPKRARNKKGQLKADDPSTPNVNEAWEDGKAPVKTTKKTTKKKTTKKKS